MLLGDKLPLLFAKFNPMLSSCSIEFFPWERVLIHACQGIGRRGDYPSLRHSWHMAFYVCQQAKYIWHVTVTTMQLEGHTRGGLLQETNVCESGHSAQASLNYVAIFYVADVHPPSDKHLLVTCKIRSGVWGGLRLRFQRQCRVVSIPEGPYKTKMPKIILGTISKHH